MNSRFRIIRWASKGAFLALAGTLLVGLWVAPRYLPLIPQALGVEAPIIQPKADPNALPPDIELPKPERNRPATDRIPPSQLSRDLLPVYFEPKSAATLFDELRAEGQPPAGYPEPWSQILFGRLMAIDEMVARHSTYYGTDYLDQLLAFAAESLLDPLAQGPQVDDRGIGQVGYWAEKVGRRWAGDPDSRYYSPDLDPDGSIWDPETNIILATTVMRWVYTSPEANSPQMAYGLYTRGHDGLRPDGNLGRDAQVRVERAESYRQRFLDFFRLKLGLGDTSPQPLLAGILALDADHEDGQDMYRALRDYYIQIVEDPADPAVAVLLAGEAVRYNDLLTRIYGEDGHAEYVRLYEALVALEPAVDALGHAETQSAHTESLSDLERRIGP